MSLSQTRIKDLDEYIQLDSGDPNYVPQSELKIPVDHPSFTRPKSYSLNFLTSTVQHIEKGKITSLSNRSVTQSYGTPFNDAPNGNVQVYRNKTIATGIQKRYDVLHYNLTITPAGFSLQIDDSEPLSGIIIEYVLI